MRVYDAFCFLDELEVLEFRLNHMRGYVDVCVISQSLKTHLGKSWEPILHDGHSLVKKFSGDFEFRFAVSSGREEKIFDRVNAQYDVIDRMLDDANPRDLIIVSDVDEIPSHHQLANMLKANSLHHSIPMKTCLGFVDLMSRGTWLHPKVSSYERFDGSQNLRKKTGLAKLKGEKGVHFSVIDGIDGWERKFARSPHTEMSYLPIDKIKEFIVLDMYPTVAAIVLWRGARLRRVKRDSLLSTQILFLRHNHSLSNRFLCPGKVESITIQDQKTLGVKTYLDYKLQQDLHPFVRGIIRVVRESPNLFSFIYVCLFPIRLWSIMSRRILLRTRMRIIQRILLSTFKHSKLIYKWRKFH